MGEWLGARRLFMTWSFRRTCAGTGRTLRNRVRSIFRVRGLLRAYRGRGLGKRIKEWEIEYAKRNGFRRVVTNCRESNAAMISINEKYGFRAIRSTPGYYEDGEATAVTELICYSICASNGGAAN